MRSWRALLSVGIAAGVFFASTTSAGATATPSRVGVRARLPQWTLRPSQPKPAAAPDLCAGTMPVAKAADVTAPGSYEYDRGTGALRLMAKSLGPAAYNPNGRHLAYVVGTAGETRMCLGDRVTATARTLFSARVVTYPNYPPQWAGPTLLFYAVEEWTGGVWMTNAYRFDLLTSVSTLFATNVTSIRVSPTNLLVAYGGRNASGGDLFIASVIGGLARHLFTNPYYGITSIHWSPDSLTVAVDDPLFLVNVVTGVWTKHFGCAGSDWGGAWSPTGDRFAVTTEHVPVECIYIIDRATGKETQIGDGGGPQDWSPDGHRLLVAGHPPTDDDRGAGALLDELSLSDGSRHRLFTVPELAGELHYLSGAYTASGRTIRFAHVVVS